MVEINYLAVVVAAVASMVIGGLWYGPLFGRQWMAFMGYTPEQCASPEMKAAAKKSYAIMFVGSLVMAYVLAFSIALADIALQTSGLSSGLMGGFWNWLGFVAPVLLGAVLWERKPWKLFFLNAAYYLVTLLVMGVILALWR
jgi:hypothetical protein